MCACCLLFRQVQYEAMPQCYVWILACASRRRLRQRYRSSYYVSSWRNTALVLNLLILSLAVGRWTDGWLPSPGGLCVRCLV